MPKMNQQNGSVPLIQDESVPYICLYADFISRNYWTIDNEDTTFFMNCVIEEIIKNKVI